MDPDVVDDLDDIQTETKTKTIYFGVYIPNNHQYNVFQEKEAALKLVKTHKKARFKAFQFFHEAVDFSMNGSEAVKCISEGGDADKSGSASLVGEKASPFRSPRPQELTQFRMQIETGNIDHVRELIEHNPRYLVSSGDTPSILQEGARLNALHVAAKSLVNNAEIADLILSTISNPDFVKRLYGDDSQENAEQRCKMLLDLYLNTPNKGFNDTPLHIASKWGAARVVEVLLSYPECDSTRRNKHNLLAEDVICERADSKVAKQRIQQLLCSNYYVPVLRAEDNTLPPSVGMPFSPTSPPVLNRDPLSPRLEIHAYAGPMDKKGAETFRKVWKTPPRSYHSPSNGVKEKLASIRLKDPDKGLERIGKTLANSYNIDWKEYWEFLDSFVDIASEEGFELLESHLRMKEKHLQEPFEEFSPLMMAKSENIVSPMTDLCAAFAACKLNDSNSGTKNSGNNRPLVYVDKACQVFANRILQSVSSILKCSEREYECVAKGLEADVKLFEYVVNSYMDDERFALWVNFQKVHSRLAHLINTRLEKMYNCDELLTNKLESVLENIAKKSDYFSSDDEARNCKEISNKPTSYRKQVLCLLSHIKLDLEMSPEAKNDKDQIATWQCFPPCSCTFHARKQKKLRNSFRNSTKSGRYHLQNVSKRLSFDDDSPMNHDLSLNGDCSRSDSEEEFFTPPSSPDASDLESDEEFSDAESPKFEVFLQGAYPTKTDCAVYNALKYADRDIDVIKYPKVYKWHHTVNLYTDSERASWPSPHVKKKVPEKESFQKPLTPSRPSWFRVTGANSPKMAATNLFHH